MNKDNSHAANPQGRDFLMLSLATLGVVYGDIGTSPLYAIRECFQGPHAIPATPNNVLGVLSLIFWSLIVVISIKYCIFILRADNRGEGGILALAALVIPDRTLKKSGQWFLILLGLFGAALLYGDGMITPAISVLSAVEGLNVATTLFESYVIPITVLILVGLFVFQHQGTAGVGRFFGPITLIWLLTIGILGIFQIIQKPEVLAALNPLHGLDFLVRNGWEGFLVLGSVFLVVTGGEAMYADMGHFGARPIRLTWFSIVLPSLVLNYFGQGALVISNPDTAENPFYWMAPSWALYPLVLLATLATVIASQAVISGVFSLTRQAIQLGYCPRMKIEHTSAQTIGQIYLPAINWGLMLACTALVVGFRSSANLAAAYGVAVTATMAITTLLFYVLLRDRWNWSLPVALLLCGLFIIIDLSFFGAATTKVTHGGWFPIVIAALVFTLMSTWKTGRRILAARLRSSALPIEVFLEQIAAERPLRVPGKAVYMYGSPTGTPPALLNNLKHNKVMHECIAILVVVTEEIPQVPPRERVDLEPIGQGCYRITVHYGFMEEPNIPKALQDPKLSALKLNPSEVSFFLGRETLFASDRPAGMAMWRERLFARMSRNALSATRFFHIPRDRVVELGTQVEL